VFGLLNVTLSSSLRCDFQCF